MILSLDSPAYADNHQLTSSVNVTSLIFIEIIQQNSWSKSIFSCNYYNTYIVLKPLVSDGVQRFFWYMRQISELPSPTQNAASKQYAGSGKSEDQKRFSVQGLKVLVNLNEFSSIWPSSKIVKVPLSSKCRSRQIPHLPLHLYAAACIYSAISKTSEIVNRL